MIIERDVDCGELYEQKRCAVIDLVRSLGEDDLHRVVPATPAWSVHDVVSHLIGICADLNALRFGSGDLEAWTAAQVRQRQERSVVELADEWDREAPKFEEGLRLLGYEIGSHYVGDLLQHTGDLCHALNTGPLADDNGLVVAADFYIDSFDKRLKAASVGSVALTIANDGWVLGAGQAVASVRGSRFEIFRALGGRRSEQQIRRLRWTGAIDAVIPLMSVYPLPDSEIRER